MRSSKGQPHPGHSQTDGGVSSARNAGLDAVRGNWIGFVDSDDIIDETRYEKLYRAVKKYGTKMAVSNILYLEADGSVSVYKDLPLQDEVLTPRRMCPPYPSDAAGQSLYEIVPPGYL